MKIIIGNDHAAIELKEDLKSYLEDKGYEVVNLGINKGEKADYPEYAKKVSEKVLEEKTFGILLCGTGVGMSIAANKVKGIRAVVCTEPYSAKLSRMHNNANVLCLGSRVLGDELAKMILDEWLSAEFEGGRHQKRVDMIESK